MEWLIHTNYKTRQLDQALGLPPGPVLDGWPPVDGYRCRTVSNLNSPGTARFETAEVPCYNRVGTAVVFDYGGRLLRLR